MTAIAPPITRRREKTILPLCILAKAQGEQETVAICEKYSDDNIYLTNLFTTPSMQGAGICITTTDQEKDELLSLEFVKTGMHRQLTLALWTFQIIIIICILENPIWKNAIVSAGIKDKPNDCLVHYISCSESKLKTLTKLG